MLPFPFPSGLSIAESNQASSAEPVATPPASSLISVNSSDAPPPPPASQAIHPHPHNLIPQLTRAASLISGFGSGVLTADVSSPVGITETAAGMGGGGGGGGALQAYRRVESWTAPSLMTAASEAALTDAGEGSGGGADTPTGIGREGSVGGGGASASGRRPIKKKTRGLKVGYGVEEDPGAPSTAASPASAFSTDAISKQAPFSPTAQPAATALSSSSVAPASAAHRGKSGQPHSASAGTSAAPWVGASRLVKPKSPPSPPPQLAGRGPVSAPVAEAPTLVLSASPAPAAVVADSLTVAEAAARRLNLPLGAARRAVGPGGVYQAPPVAASPTRSESSSVGGQKASGGLVGSGAPIASGAATAPPAPPASAPGGTANFFSLSPASSVVRGDGGATLPPGHDPGASTPTSSQPGPSGRSFMLSSPSAIGPSVSTMMVPHGSLSSAPSPGALGGAGQTPVGRFEAFLAGLSGPLSVCQREAAAAADKVCNTSDDIIQCEHYWRPRSEVQCEHYWRPHGSLGGVTPDLTMCSLGIRITFVTLSGSTTA